MRVYMCRPSWRAGTPLADLDPTARSVVAFDEPLCEASIRDSARWCTAQGTASRKRASPLVCVCPPDPPLSRASTFVMLAVGLFFPTLLSPLLSLAGGADNNVNGGSEARRAPR